jgi:hypothetical protein
LLLRAARLHLRADVGADGLLRGSGFKRHGGGLMLPDLPLLSTFPVPPP